jgi:hypothetical protein
MTTDMVTRAAAPPKQPSMRRLIVAATIGNVPFCRRRHDGVLGLPGCQTGLEVLGKLYPEKTRFVDFHVKRVSESARADHSSHSTCACVLMK